jgi:polyhydroxyalkanoate synthesis repressor PhaR
MRVIKRYANRKLYDTGDKTYISLPKVRALIKDGHEVQVIDNTNGNDITTHVLTQIILDDGKKGEDAISPATLHELIRWGNDIVDNSIDQVKDGVGQVRDRVDRLVQNSVKRLMNVTGADEITVLRSRVKELENVIDKLLKQIETAN